MAVIINLYALRAPEVILHAPYDTKVDIWALGCLVRPHSTNSMLRTLAELS